MLAAPSPTEVGGDAPTLESLLNQSDRLTPMPAVVIKLLDVLRDGSANFERVAHVIERDQAITATVLKLANSAMYRGRNEIDTVSQAVSRIGLNPLRDVVLAATVLKLPGHSLMEVERLRKEMLASGTAARLLARATNVDSERAFVAGLLQDVGRFLLTVVDAHSYAIATAEVDPFTDDFVHQEREWLGYTHAEVGAALAERWRFPSNLVDSIASQHHPEAAHDEETARMTAVAALGNVVGSRHVRRAPALSPEDLAAHALGKLVDLRPTQLASFAAEFAEEFANMSRVFHL